MHSIRKTNNLTAEIRNDFKEKIIIFISPKIAWSALCSKYVGIVNASETEPVINMNSLLNLLQIFYFIQIHQILTNNLLYFQINGQEAETTEFAPHVSATCKAGVMNIKVAFNGTYTGTVHARDFRNSNCMVVGDGSSSVSLSLNMLAKQGQTDFCGILVSNVNAEVSWIDLWKTKILN